MQKLADISLFEKLGENLHTCNPWITTYIDNTKASYTIDVQNALISLIGLTDGEKDKLQTSVSNTVTPVSADEIGDISTRSQLLTSLLQEYSDGYLAQWSTPNRAVFKRRLKTFSNIMKEDIKQNYTNASKAGSYLVNLPLFREWNKIAFSLGSSEAQDDKSIISINTDDKQEISVGPSEQKNAFIHSEKISNALDKYMDYLNKILHKSYVDISRQRLQEIYKIHKQRHPMSGSIVVPSDYEYLIDNGWSYIEENLNKFQDVVSHIRDSLIKMFKDDSALNFKNRPLTTSPVGADSVNAVSPNSDRTAILSPSYSVKSDNSFAGTSFTV